LLAYGPLIPRPRKTRGPRRARRGGGRWAPTYGRPDRASEVELAGAGWWRRVPSMEMVRLRQLRDREATCRHLSLAPAQPVETGCEVRTGAYHATPTLCSVEGRVGRWNNHGDPGGRPGGCPRRRLPTPFTVRSKRRRPPSEALFAPPGGKRHRPQIMSSRWRATRG